MTKKVILILLLVILFLFFLFFMFLVFSPNQRGNPVPTLFIKDSGGAGGGAAINTAPSATEKDRESALVIQMGQKLPYYGKNFSLFYDYNSNLFILHLNPLTKDSGNKEFDAFLKTNKIDSQLWVDNLTIVYQKP